MKKIIVCGLLAVMLVLSVTVHAQNTGGGTPGLAFELIPNTIDYIVVRGDTLSRIARVNEVSIQSLLEINRYRSSDDIRVGDVVKIPVQDSAYRVSKGTVTSGAVIIPASYNGLPVTEIGNEVFMDTNITSVTIPSSVTSIGAGTFIGCNSLTSITIPSSVASIGAGTFIGCNSLTSVTISSSVTSIGVGAFGVCISLTNITVDTQNPAYSSLDGILFNKNRNVLVCYPAGKQGVNYTIPSGVTSIWAAAFAGCTSLTSVTIPSSVIYIEDGAFHFCGNLTSVTIPSSVTSIGNRAFEGCRSLTSITIPSSVTSIGDQAFLACESLTSVTMSRRTRIGTDAFPSTARITYSD